MRSFPLESLLAVSIPYALSAFFCGVLFRLYTDLTVARLRWVGCDWQYKPHIPEHGPIHTKNLQRFGLESPLASTCLAVT